MDNHLIIVKALYKRQRHHLQRQKAREDGH